MYAYTLVVPGPPDVYLAMHRAVLDVVSEDGGGDGLLLHLVRGPDHGCELTEVWESKDRLDQFNNTVFPRPSPNPGADGRAAAGACRVRPDHPGDPARVQLGRLSLTERSTALGPTAWP